MMLLVLQLSLLLLRRRGSIYENRPHQRVHWAYIIVPFHLFVFPMSLQVGTISSIIFLAIAIRDVELPQFLYHPLKS